MTTQYTSLLGLALPQTGDLSGSWGDVVNDSITQLVEDSVAGYATADVTSGNWTLSTTGYGVANQARMMVLRPTGTPGVSRNIIAPAQSKIYFVVNDSDNAVVIKGSSTTGVSIAAGKNTVVVWDGSDFVEIYPTNTTNAVNATNATTATNLASGVQGSVPYQSAANTTSLLSPGTNGQVLTSGGASANPSWTSIAATAFAWTAKQTFNGSSSTLATKLINASEAVTVSATAATGTINYDVTTQSVLYYTTAASANWTMNFRASSGTTLNSALDVGESITVVFMATNGATAYYNNAITIDGTSVTPKYQGGIAWSYGSASGIDAYTYTIIKTASATYTVLASQIRFA